MVCTVEPASDSQEVLEQMIRDGMDVVRLNFSHGDFTGHKEKIEKIRAASQATGRRVAIMAELPGPKMRIGNNCLKFALEQGVDAVILSFVETGKDIQQVRDAAQKLGHHPFIIAEIERSRTLDNLASILGTADAIMITRGDLEPASSE